MLSRVVSIVAVVLLAWSAASLVYHYLLLFAGLRRPRRLATPSLSQRFAIAIPAHNEEAVIGETLRRLAELDYPFDRCAIYVIADYCDDRTVERAAASGAEVLVRNAGPRGRKAYALQWFCEQVFGPSAPHDALVVIDADSRLDVGFLRAMSAALDAGMQVVQGQHIIAQSDGSDYALLASIDMYLNNLLRNRAKDNLGLSARLMGDAMCFAAAVIQAHGWAAESLGEDREYGLYLARQGVRIRYLPDARSYGQAAPDWRSATSQRQRWVGGDLQIKRRYLVTVFRQLVARPTWPLFDQLAEFLLPNYSIAILLATLSLLGALAASMSGDSLFFFVATLLLWLAFPLLGLLAARAPKPYYRALLQGPKYVIWRLFVTLRAAARSKRIEWVRTRRSEEKP